MGWRKGEGDPVLLAGITSQRFVCQADGEWLIADMRFDQLQMLPLPTHSLPTAVALEPHQ